MVDAGAPRPAAKDPGRSFLPIRQSPFLLPDRPLVLMPRLATLIGLDEAIVLQQVRYWLGDDRRPHVRDGQRWVYNTYQQWHEQLPFFPERSLRRKFVKLEQAGLLKSGKYNEDAFDHTKWYTVDFDRLLELELAWRARAAAEGGGHAGRGRRTRGRRDQAGQGDGSALPPIPGSNLLIDADPLIVLPSLALAIGLNEAIVLQQVFYWLGDDRKPQSRDGRRWVYNTYRQWQEDNFPFWSLRTVQETFLSLENQGLLISEHFNLSRGDRTKWYSIDFDRLDEVMGTPTGYGPASPTMPKHSPQRGEEGSRNTGHIDDAGMAGSSGQPRAILGSGQECAMARPELRDDDARMAASSPTETTTEISPETPQKQQQAEVVQPNADVVVAPTSSPVDLVSRLVDRGVTGTAARQLAAAYPPDLIARQIEMFDWEREKQPDEEKMTPGRLRRRIEQDWAQPPGFVPQAERVAREEQQAAERARYERRRAEARRAEEEQQARREAEFRALLEAAALEPEEQRHWRLLLDTPRRIDLRLQDTFFRAPRDGAPPLIVFRNREDHAAITAPHGREIRAEIMRRLPARFPDHWRELMARPPLYVVYDDLVHLLASEAPGDNAGAPTEADREGTDDRADGRKR